jgi:phosphinothricin acetyltransferase
MIRAARHDDFSAIASITNHYVATTAIHFAYEPLTVAHLLAMWEKGGDRFPWFVADQGGVLGYAKAGTWRDRAAYSWTAEIGLYIAHDARGQGLGRALYSELLDQLAARGFRSAIAGITLPNDPSVALHEAFGFVSVGTVRDAGWKSGAWHDVEFWQKRFATDSTPPAAG